MSDTVIIPRQDYEYLLEAATLLNALRAAGVDNWDGYDIALEMLEEAD